MKHRLREYCDLLAGAPVSVTSVHGPDELWRVQVEDALSALPVVERLAPRSIVDVGSGGGSPGIPLAIVAGIPVSLLESRSGKVDFLREAVARLGLSCEVVLGRSEDVGRGSGRDAWDMAVARALAPPPAAAELCLPLVRPGGHVVLWTANLEPGPLAAAAAQVGGELVEVVSTGGRRALAVVAKVAPTPERFPRRPGVARRRPLASVPSSA